MTKILFLVLVLLSSALAIKIVLLPTFGYSHTLALAKLGEELGRRNHEVALIQFNITKEWKNMRTYSMKTSVTRDFILSMMYDPKKVFKHERLKFFNVVSYLSYGMETLIDNVLNDKTAVSLIENCDLIVTEVCFIYGKVLSKLFNKPMVGTHYLGESMLKPYYRISSESYVPNFGSSVTERIPVHLKLLQHFESSVLFSVLNFWQNRFLARLGAKYNISSPMYMNDFSIVISSYDPLIEYPQPLHPFVFAVGTWTLEPSKRLPELYTTFINSSKNGFVLVGFGTVFTLQESSEKDLNELVTKLSTLKYNIILKVDPKRVTNIPKNILMSNDIPQNDLLGHPDIKLFVTHAGFGGTRETCFHGVPVLALPRAADQLDYAFLLANRMKIGKTIDFGDWDEMIKSIEEVINDPSIRENANRCYQMMHSKPWNYSRILAADIVERFVKWDYNASHLRPYVLDMPWYEYYALDVLALLVTAIILPYFIAKRVLNLFY